MSTEERLRLIRKLNRVKVLYQHPQTSEGEKVAALQSMRLILKRLEK
jgi:hypothetical protein